MKKIIDFYFRHIVAWNAFDISIIVAQLLGFMLASIISGSYGAAIIDGILLIFSIPILLINLGILNRRRMSSKIIDLANYDFGEDTLDADFHIPEERAKTLDRLYKLVGGDIRDQDIQAFSLARKTAIEHDLSAEEYLYLIMRAATILGLAQNKKKDLAPKLEELKKELKDRLANMPPPDKNDNPSQEGGKYGFL